MGPVKTHGCIRKRGQVSDVSLNWISFENNIRKETGEIPRKLLTGSLGNRPRKACKRVDPDEKTMIGTEQKKAQLVRIRKNYI